MHALRPTLSDTQSQTHTLKHTHSHAHTHSHTDTHTLRHTLTTTHIHTRSPPTIPFSYTHSPPHTPTHPNPLSILDPRPCQRRRRSRERLGNLRGGWSSRPRGRLTTNPAVFGGRNPKSRRITRIQKNQPDVKARTVYLRLGGICGMRSDADDESIRGRDDEFGGEF